MDTGMVVSVLALFVACLALIVSVRAIRRDAPALRITWSEGAAGSRYIRIVNVGLRPARLEKIVVRPRTWWRTAGRPEEVPFSIIGGHYEPLAFVSRDEREEPPLVILQPGQDAFVGIGVMASQKAMRRGFEYEAEDSAGRRYPVRHAASLSKIPPAYTGTAADPPS